MLKLNSYLSVNFFCFKNLKIPKKKKKKKIKKKKKKAFTKKLNDIIKNNV